MNITVYRFGKSIQAIHKCNDENFHTKRFKIAITTVQKLEMYFCQAIFQELPSFLNDSNLLKVDYFLDNSRVVTNLENNPIHIDNETQVFSKTVLLAKNLGCNSVDNSVDISKLYNFHLFFDIAHIIPLEYIDIIIFSIPSITLYLLENNVGSKQPVLSLEILFHFYPMRI